MTHRPLSIGLLFGAALLVLGGCQTDVASNSKHLKPIPPKTVALMEKKGMTKQSPILVRIYKEESQLEIWKKDKTGRFAHLKTYEICRWSGTLGPKKVEGDGQSPEGFYSVGPAQLNPKSSYYLSFNLGYPNAYDRSLGRTGAHLMVHGDCLSKGCYAMTDEQIAEVYAIARDALNGGQPSFQVQALPFRMTAQNMARRRDDRNFAFWENLKEGTDHFELTKLEPKVDVCSQKYVFDAEAKDGGRFDPNAACPAYEVQPAIAMAMAGKKQQDEQKFEELVSGGLQVAEAYEPQNGRIRRTLKEPIREPAPKSQSIMVAERAPQTTGSVALAMADTGSAAPMPAPSPFASAQPKPKSGGMFAWLHDTPSELRTEETPRAAAAATTGTSSGATTVAMASPRKPAEPAQPVAASMAPPVDRPLYKRLFSFVGTKQEAAPAPAPVAAPPVPKAAAVVPAPVPAPRPAAPAPAVPAPAPQAAAEPAPQPQPSRASMAHDAFGTAPILNSGTFQ